MAASGDALVGGNNLGGRPAPARITASPSNAPPGAGSFDDHSGFGASTFTISLAGTSVLNH